MGRLQPQALKGRANGSPFQGSRVQMEGAVRPRALPWAVVGRPFGAQDGVAQTAVFAVCGSSLGSRSRTQGQIPVSEICGFPMEEPRTPKTGVRATRTHSQAAHVLRLISAPHERGQHPCHRVPSVAESGFRGTGTPFDKLRVGSACVLWMGYPQRWVQARVPVPPTT
jgi:hypothetical protein